MPDSHTTTLFVFAALVLLLAPGPAVIYIVTRSIEQGRAAGVVSTLGLGVGNIIHVAAAALGVSALLVSSAVAFSVVKYLGAAYLIFLGVRRLLSRGGEVGAGGRGRRPLAHAFTQGVLVNLLNPKTGLFFFSFLPQFVDPSRGSVSAQLLTLGLIFVALGVVSDICYALLAGSLGKWLKGNARFVRAEQYVSGGVYIGLGAAAALSSPNRS